MPRTTYIIICDDDSIARAATIAQVERSGQDALPGVYIFDVLHREPVDGYVAAQPVH